MSAAPRRATRGTAAVGIAQCVVLGVAALAITAWAFVELTKQLALTTAPLLSEAMLFWSLVGSVAVLLLAGVAGAMLWRGRAVGFVVLAVAWLPAVPLGWTAVSSYLDLVADEEMSRAVTVSLVAAGANLVLGLLRAPASSAHPPLAR
ncbi:hypothetical protein [Mumia quercus]|uniref:hypothetical protein n=1 Tax=Mumia quercus TaxID=2976125 RepID=UPI0021CE1FBD|nr:hypothetical protein [Mumia quercus]